MRRLAPVLLGPALLTLGLVGCLSAESPERSQLNPPVIGDTDGCAAAYWSQPQNFSSWEEYQPGQLVGTVFSNARPYEEATLAEALELEDDPANGAARASLMREAVVGLLNAAHDSLEFPYRRYDPGIDGRPGLVPHTNELMASGSAEQIEAFVAELSSANALSCPLE